MFTVVYRGKTISYSKYNIHIKDSVLVRTAAEMEAILKFIVARAAKRGIEFKRSITSWVREWKAHNLLCDHNYKIERTESSRIEICFK